MGFEPVLSFGRPCDLPGLSFELVSVCVVVPLVLPPRQRAMEVSMGLAQVGGSCGWFGCASRVL
jgi:hypothetical protein